MWQTLKSDKSDSIYTITVAGTNGKGSCVALLESILIASGYRVGVYSTPHLTHYNERIRVDGRSVSDSMLTRVFSKINSARQAISLSYFEFGTLAALDIFCEQKLDIQILEVGLGGRLDAVNIVDANAALVTSISIDHIDWLGDDINQIALEKAGIFRTKQVAVCGDKAVPQSLIDHANKLDVNLLLAGQDFDFKVEHNGWQLIADHSFAGNYPTPPLHGAHQIQNASAVISLLAQIQNKVPVTRQDIEFGLAHVSLTGRLQQVNSAPDVFLDVAHNAESAMALAEFLKTRQCKGRIHAVFSIFADKQLNQVIEPFLGLVDQWHIASLNSTRSVSVENLQDFLTNDLTQHCSQYDSIQHAFKQVRAILNKDDLVICFGSFYVVEACLEAL